MFSMTACGSGETESAEPAASQGTNDPQLRYVVYEAIFLDHDEIQECFRRVRGADAPYANTTSDFHITTAFLPETDARGLYGLEATVHIVGYKVGEVMNDDGVPTYNEGFSVTVQADDPALSKYLSDHDVNWHITGSYSEAPKYTGYLDFSDADAADFTVTGTFGAFLNGGMISFDAADVDTVIG